MCARLAFRQCLVLVSSDVSPRSSKELLGNLDEWNFDSLRPDTYKVLATALQQSHVPRAARVCPRDTVSEQARCRDWLRLLGCTHVIYSNSEALVTFTLGPPTP